MNEPSKEPTLVSILQAYLEAVDAGQNPDREELLRQNPNLADELREFFADDEKMNRFAQSLHKAQVFEATIGIDRPVETEKSPVRIRYFGDYELLEEIARGGMGVVYKARQVNLKRIVALKLILAGQLAGAQEVERFHAEAEAAAKLDHPGIVPIFEVGQHEGQHYFSMAFVEGESLAHHVARGVMEPREAAVLMERVAEAIAYAHTEGVIHRDLKPANILLDKGGTPRVTDFGLAKQVEDESQGLTATGQVLGTPSYMAPEQAQGDNARIGPLADVYSLGAVLYCLLTGRPPFQAASTVETLLQVVAREPVRPKQLNAAVPRDLETITLKCLDKEPSRRYGSAQALANDLGRWVKGEPITARRAGAIEKTIKWVKRRPVVASLLAAVLVVTLAGVAGIAWAWSVALRERNYAQAQEKKALEQKAKADTERADAVAARALTETEKTRAEKQLRRAEWLVYEDKLGRVQQELQLANFGVAQSLLENCYWDLRGWEHRYLYTLLNQRMRVVEKHDSPVHSVSISRDGKRLAVGAIGKVMVWDLQAARELLTLELKNGTMGFAVESVAFSPDGKSLAAASFQTFKVWDVESGKECLSVREPVGEFHSLVFSPDGKHVATASSDKTVRIWDTRTRKEPRIFRGHSGAVRSVAISSDGKRLASGASREVKVWDVEAGKEMRTFKGTSPLSLADCSAFYGVAFSPDNKRLASAWQDDRNFRNRAVKVWDLETGKEVLSVPIQRGSVASICFSPDGKRLAAGSGFPDILQIEPGEIKVWEAGTGEETITLKGHSGPVRQVVFSSDGMHLASAGDDTARVWEAQPGPPAIALPGHTGRVDAVAFSPDGKRLASASEDATVKVWDLDSGRELFTFAGHKQPGNNPPVTGVAFSPNGKCLASAAGAQIGSPFFVTNGLKVWDAKTGKETLVLEDSRGAFSAVGFSASGRYLAAVRANPFASEVVLWDAQTGKKTRVIRPHSPDFYSAVGFNPDGKQLAGAGFRKNKAGKVLSGVVTVWDAETGNETLTLRGHAAEVVGLAYSQDGKRLATASCDKTVKIWDAETGEEIHTLRGHTKLVQSVAFTPDGTRLASASWDGAVKVWDTQTGQEAVTLLAHGGGADAVAFSPDGRFLASGGFLVDREGTAHGEVKVWDAAERQKAVELPRQGLFVRSVAFSPDGNRLACAGNAENGQSQVKLWDAQTAEEVLTLNRPPCDVQCVAFSPDGRILACAGGIPDAEAKNGGVAGQVKVWDADGKELLTLSRATDVEQVAFSSDGNRLAGIERGGTVSVWETKTGKQVLAIRNDCESLFCSLAYSPDGRRLVSCARNDSGVKIWDAQTGEAILKLGDFGVWSIALSPDGKRLAAGEQLWDIETAKPILKLPVNARAVAFSPDGRRLATGSDGGTAKLWDAGTGKEMFTLRGRRGTVGCVTFSPNGKRLASCSDDWVIIWDLTQAE
jgi:WD40 repeat protein/tRNA A-37 threonylcarbamoyl transferase component Bud32